MLLKPAFYPEMTKSFLLFASKITAHYLNIKELGIAAKLLIYGAP